MATCPFVISLVSMLHRNILKLALLVLLCIYEAKLKREVVNATTRLTPLNELVEVEHLLIFLKEIEDIGI